MANFRDKTLGELLNDTERAEFLKLRQQGYITDELIPKFYDRFVRELENADNMALHEDPQSGIPFYRRLSTALYTDSAIIRQNAFKNAIEGLSERNRPLWRGIAADYGGLVRGLTVDEQGEVAPLAETLAAQSAGEYVREHGALTPLHLLGSSVRTVAEGVGDVATGRIGEYGEHPLEHFAKIGSVIPVGRIAGKGLAASLSQSATRGAAKSIGLKTPALRQAVNNLTRNQNMSYTQALEQLAGVGVSRARASEILDTLTHHPLWRIPAHGTEAADILGAREEVLIELMGEGTLEATGVGFDVARRRFQPTEVTDGSIQTQIEGAETPTAEPDISQDSAEVAAEEGMDAGVTEQGEGATQEVDPIAARAEANEIAAQETQQRARGPRIAATLDAEAIQMASLTQQIATGVDNPTNNDIINLTDEAFVQAFESQIAPQIAERIQALEDTGVQNAGDALRARMLELHQQHKAELAQPTPEQSAATDVAGQPTQELIDDAIETRDSEVDSVPEPSGTGETGVREAETDTGDVEDATTEQQDRDVAESASEQQDTTVSEIPVAEQEVAPPEEVATQPDAVEPAPETPTELPQTVDMDNIKYTQTTVRAIFLESNKIGAASIIEEVSGYRVEGSETAAFPNGIVLVKQKGKWYPFTEQDGIYKRILEPIYIAYTETPPTSREKALQGFNRYIQDTERVEQEAQAALPTPEPAEDIVETEPETPTETADDVDAEPAETTEAEMTVEEALAINRVNAEQWNDAPIDGKRSFLNKQEQAIPVHLHTRAIDEAEAEQKRKSIEVLRRDIEETPEPVEEPAVEVEQPDPTEAELHPETFDDAQFRQGVLDTLRAGKLYYASNVKDYYAEVEGFGNITVEISRDSDGLHTTAHITPWGDTGRMGELDLTLEIPEAESRQIYAEWSEKYENGEDVSLEELTSDLTIAALEAPQITPEQQTEIDQQVLNAIEEQTSITELPEKTGLSDAKVRVAVQNLLDAEQIGPLVGYNTIYMRTERSYSLEERLERSAQSIAPLTVAKDRLDKVIRTDLGDKGLTETEIEDNVDTVKQRVSEVRKELKAQQRKEQAAEKRKQARIEKYVASAKTKKAKVRLWVRLEDAAKRGSSDKQGWVEGDGYEINNIGTGDIQFILHRPYSSYTQEFKGDGWDISEKKTGTKITSGSTQKVAIEQAVTIYQNTGKEKFQQVIADTLEARREAEADTTEETADVAETPEVVEEPTADETPEPTDAQASADVDIPAALATVNIQRADWEASDADSRRALLQDAYDAELDAVDYDTDAISAEFNQAFNTLSDTLDPVLSDILGEPQEILTPQENVNRVIASGKVNKAFIDSLMSAVEDGIPSKIIGQKVSSDEDVAALSYIARDPKIEKTSYFFLKDGEVVWHTAVSINQRGLSGVLPAPTLKAIMKVVGATHIGMVHNHPTGNVIFSGSPSLAMIEAKDRGDRGTIGDFTAFRALQSSLGKRLLHFVITNEKSYGYFGRDKQTGKIIARERVPFTDTSPQDAIASSEAHHDSSWITIVGTNDKNEIVWSMEFESGMKFANPDVIKRMLSTNVVRQALDVKWGVKNFDVVISGNPTREALEKLRDVYEEKQVDTRNPKKKLSYKLRSIWRNGKRLFTRGKQETEPTADNRTQDQKIKDSLVRNLLGILPKDDGKLKAPIPAHKVENEKVQKALDELNEGQEAPEELLLPELLPKRLTQALSQNITIERETINVDGLEILVEKFSNQQFYEPVVRNIGGMDYYLTPYTMPDADTSIATHAIRQRREADTDRAGEIGESGRLVSSRILARTHPEIVIGEDISAWDQITDNADYVFFAPLHGPYIQSDSDGFFVDAEALIRAGAVVSRGDSFAFYRPITNQILEEHGVKQEDVAEHAVYGGGTPQVAQAYDAIQKAIEQPRAENRFSGEQALEMLRRGEVAEILVPGELSLDALLGVYYKGEAYQLVEATSMTPKEATTEADDYILSDVINDTERGRDITNPKRGILQILGIKTRQSGRMARHAFESGFGTIQEMRGTPAEPQIGDKLYDDVINMGDVFHNEFGQENFRFDEFMTEFANIASRRITPNVVDRLNPQQRGLRAEYRTSASNKVWRFIEENQEITDDPELADFANRFKEFWRGLQLKGVKAMLAKVKEVKDLYDEDIYIVDSKGNRVPWYPESFDGFKWDAAKERFSKGDREYTVEEAHREADRLYTPHYFRHHVLRQEYRKVQKQLDAMDKVMESDNPEKMQGTLRSLSISKEDTDTGDTTSTFYRFDITGEEFQKVEDALVVVRDYLSQRSTYFREMLQYHDAGIRNERRGQGTDEPRIGHYGQLERARQTGDQNYERNIGLLKETRKLMWHRFAEISTIGQTHPFDGNSPRMEQNIKEVREFDKNDRERALRAVGDALRAGHPDSMFERLPEFARGTEVGLGIQQDWVVYEEQQETDAKGETITKRVKTDEPVEIDIQRMNLPQNVLDTLEKIGFIDKNADGQYKIAGDTVAERHLTMARYFYEFYNTIARRENRVRSLFMSLGHWDSRNPLEMDEEQFFDKVNDMVTVGTIGYGTSLLNLVESLGATQDVATINTIRGIRTMLNKEKRDMLLQLSSAMSNTARFLTDTSLGEKYFTSGWSLFSHTDKHSRAFGIAAGLENAKDLIRKYSKATGKKKDALRRTMLFYNLNPNIVDTVVAAGDIEAQIKSAESQIFAGDVDMSGTPAEQMNLANAMLRAGRFLSNEVFKRYDATSLPPFLMRRSPFLRLFTKFKSWQYQQNRQQYKRAQFVRKEAQQGNFIPAWNMAQGMAILGGTYAMMGFIWSANREEEHPAMRFMEGMLEAQTFGYASVLLQLALRAEGNWYRLQKDLVSQLGGPAGSITAGIVSPIITGDFGQAGDQLLYRIPVANVLKRTSGFRLPEVLEEDDE